MPVKRTFIEELEFGGWFDFSIDGVIYSVDAMGFSTVVDGDPYVCNYAICPLNSEGGWNKDEMFNSIDELLEYKLVDGTILKNRLNDIKEIHRIVCA